MAKWEGGREQAREGRARGVAESEGGWERVKGERENEGERDLLMIYKTPTSAT